MDKPEVHLWETGITRITRHPQNTGQLIWCFAHLLWMGNSFVLTTSAALVAHHVFACYHGDFRLKRKHGEVQAAAAKQGTQSCTSPDAQCRHGQRLCECNACCMIMGLGSTCTLELVCDTAQSSQHVLLNVAFVGGYWGSCQHIALHMTVLCVCYTMQVCYQLLVIL